jgi:hypothetical protein
MDNLGGRKEFRSPYNGLLVFAAHQILALRTLHANRVFAHQRVDAWEFLALR